MTAYFLQKLAPAPLAVTLLEQSSRLGGKILTRQFHSQAVPYEAGAAEIYDYTPVGEDPLKELIEELGLSTIPMGGFSVVMNGQILANLDDIRSQLGEPTCRELERFDREARDAMTPREFYHADLPEAFPASPDRRRFDEHLAQLQQPAARQFVEHLIHSDLATEPARTNVSYGLQNYLMNDPAYMKLYSIEGGNERIVTELVRRIEADVRLEHHVKRVERSEQSGWCVTSRHGGEVRRDEFDFVVVALPNNYLPTIEFSGPRLAEAMQRHHRHYDYPAHYLRITILFDRPFWRDKLHDSYVMLDAFDGCCLYDESSRTPESRHGVLGWLLGGEAARKMSELPDEQLVELALASLPAFLGDGRSHFVEGHVHRWINAVNGIPGGMPRMSLDRRHQPEPLEHADLYVVGDYLFDSTLNGVLDSADHVAHGLAAEILARTSVLGSNF